MCERELLETRDAFLRELQSNDPVIRFVARARNQPGRLRAIDELDRAVMAKLKVIGDLADRRTASDAVPTHREQQLVLCRR